MVPERLIILGVNAQRPSGVELYYWKITTEQKNGMGPMRFERTTSRLSAGCTTCYATGPWDSSIKSSPRVIIPCGLDALSVARFLNHVMIM